MGQRCCFDESAFVFQILNFGLLLCTARDSHGHRGLQQRNAPRRDGGALVHLIVWSEQNARGSSVVRPQYAPCLCKTTTQAKPLTYPSLTQGVLVVPWSTGSVCLEQDVNSRIPSELIVKVSETSDTENIPSSPCSIWKVHSHIPPVAPLGVGQCPDAQDSSVHRTRPCLGFVELCTVVAGYSCQLSIAASQSCQVMDSMQERVLNSIWPVPKIDTPRVAP